jgi:hypothetical protein
LGFSYSNSRRYGAEEKDAFNPTFMDGLAEAHREWRYVVANRVPVRPHGSVKTPIVSVDCFLYFLDWKDKVVDRSPIECCCPPAEGIQLIF